MAKVEKTNKPIDISYDWKPEISAIVKALNKIGIDYRQEQVSAATFTMLGDKKMTPSQRVIFDKMYKRDVEEIRKKALAESMASISQLSSEIDKINAKKILIKKKNAEIETVTREHVGKIMLTMDQAANDYVSVVEKNIKSYLKGKARKKVKIRQTAKHVIKTPLAIAAVPVGFFLSATGLGAPVGIVALLSAMQSLKGTWNFIQRHHGGIQKLEQQIPRTIRVLTDRSDEYAKLADKADHDADARKELSIVKSKIGKKEAMAYGFQTFLKVNTASIGKLDMLLDKYQKKIHEMRKKTTGIGKKIDQAEAEIKKIERKILQRQEEIKVIPGALAKHGVTDQTITKAVANMKKKNDEAKSCVATLKTSLKDHKDDIDDALDAFFKKEAELKAWSKRLEEFKAQRPASLQHWKKAIKGLDLLTTVASSALGGASDVISPATKAVEVTFNVIGHLDEASGYVMDAYGEISNQVSKHH